MAGSVFSKSEKQVISALYQLDRWATAYEISEWADLSYPTTSSILVKFKKKGIVESEKLNGKKQWRIIA